MDRKAYELAEANTVRNSEGRPVILKDDEWRDETEWDELFEELSKGRPTLEDRI